ncbi:MAG TPA: addiction module toxin, HicA family [Dehalococcoidia bacterium]|nr:addiction module toxin, HicA family [Dehalococcoidia bacterium]
MPELPIVSGDQCISALERIGYRVARTRGSHVRMRCPGRRPVTVPKHNKLDRGTMRAILRTADISIDEFIQLVKG